MRQARCQWLTPAILAPWKSEIWGMVAQGQPQQIVWETPIYKNIQNKVGWRMAQAIEHLLYKYEHLI
jgi:hypothetical protein